MKCLILAGGRGERLWPLSRKNFPKQFIKVQKDHSLFQETVARNLPYCDEFLIVTNREYRDIVLNQLEAFQGISFRCVFEEEPRKTTAAIVLTCLALQPSEYVFVVAADHLIGSEGYQDAILKGKEEAGKGKIVVFGKKTDRLDSRFGYIAEGRLVEKPDESERESLRQKNALQNIGLILFRNGVFLNEVSMLQDGLFRQCRAAYDRRRILPEGTVYEKEVLRTVTPAAVEKSVLEKTEKLFCVPIRFPWEDIGSLEDLGKTRFMSEGVGIIHGGENTAVWNQVPRQAVLVNGVKNVLVVNTADAVYVGEKGKSPLLKEILRDHGELRAFSEEGTRIYRPWGYREKIVEEERYRVQRVTVLPGKTICEHRHEERTENWTIIQGSAFITLNGEGRVFRETESAEARAGIVHQISNNGEKDLVLIETAVGEVLRHDMVFGSGSPVTESALGFPVEPAVRLVPAYKDYLWGGTRLRDYYHKTCDYDTIAESWELSAHPAGSSVIASGRHRGMSFGNYLETVGKEVLGWKCAPLRRFPLLVKFIDARENLSVQVHPDDDYALENEKEGGKNEMWIVADAGEGAGVYIGFRRGVSRGEVRERAADGTILELLNFIPTKPGDVFFIPAGTVHAIGAGNLICEIQQSSNTTYRLYDYGRKDSFGKPRELHLEKALDVLDCQEYRPSGFRIREEDGVRHISCKYFETAIAPVAGEKEIRREDDSFRALVCIGGKGKIALKGSEYPVTAGECLFLPASGESMTASGDMTVAIIKV